MLENKRPPEIKRPIDLISNHRAVIFDWDDTVVESFHLWSGVIADFVEHRGFTRPELDHIRQAWGRPIRDILVHLTGEDDLGVTEEYSAYIPDDLEVNPLVGAHDTLTHLKHAGYDLGVISSSSRDHIQRSLGRTFHVPSDFFTFIVAHGECEYTKPHPGVFNGPLTLLAERGICLEEAVYIGDSLGDYFAARDAGLDFVAVTTGVAKPSDFVREGLAKQRIFDSIADLVR